MSLWTKEKIKERLDTIRKDVNEFGFATKGKKEMLMFCDNKNLTPKQSIWAHCYQCMGYFNNPGEERDCENPVCPTYPSMPYSKNKRISRVLSAEQKEKMAENLKKITKNKKL